MWGTPPVAAEDSCRTLLHHPIEVIAEGYAVCPCLRLERRHAHHTTTVLLPWAALWLRARTKAHLGTDLVCLGSWQLRVLLYSAVKQALIRQLALCVSGGCCRAHQKHSLPTVQNWQCQLFASGLAAVLVRRAVWLENDIRTACSHTLLSTAKDLHCLCAKAVQQNGQGPACYFISLLHHLPAKKSADQHHNRCLSCCKRVTDAAAAALFFAYTPANAACHCQGCRWQM